MTPVTLALDRATRRLLARVADLESRLDTEPALWGDYLRAVEVLTLVVAETTPERRGAYLSTAQMAERLGITPKSLLRKKARGQIKPALAHGKLIRWKGTEAGR